jgi:TonB family protein
MKSRATAALQRRKPKSVLIFILCILILTGVSNAQEKLDPQALLRETQKISNTSGQLTMVWWVPEQFWQAAAERSAATGNSTQIEELLKVLRRYTLVCIVDGQLGSLGGITYKSEELIRSSVTVKDSRGASYAPLLDSEVSPDMKILLLIFKPIFTNTAGTLGQNMNFLLFPSQDKNGRPVADPKSTGKFDVLVAGKEFTYQLPLGSVLPPKYDPTTGESFPGNYNFNPVSGSKLITQSPIDLGTISQPPLPPPPSVQGSRAPLPVSGEVQAGKLIFHPAPAYPALARTARVGGAVTLQSIIGTDGKIKDLKVISSSNPLLLPGVIETVKTWEYKPTLLNAVPVEVITTITINFTPDPQAPNSVP